MDGEIEKQTIIAYSSMEEYELNEYKAGIESMHPNLKVDLMRVSTSELHDIIIDEGKNGKWDILLGTSLTSLVDAPLLAQLAPLPNVPLEKLHNSVRDTDSRWFSPSGFIPAFCINEKYLNERNIPTPKNWRDLAHPVFQNEIVLPDPNYSGAGFLQLTALLQKLGHEDTFETLKKVSLNKPRIVRSAFAPCTAVINGEASVGITVSTAAQQTLKHNSDFRMVIPNDSNMFEAEGFAMRKGSKSPIASQQALTWMLSQEAAHIYEKYFKIVTMNFDSLDNTLTSIDHEKAARTRNNVCKDWDNIFINQ